MKKAMFWLVIAAAWFAYYQFILPGKMSTTESGTTVLTYAELTAHVKGRSVEQVFVTKEGGLHGRLKNGQRFTVQGALGPEYKELFREHGVKITVFEKPKFIFQVLLAVVFVVVAYFFSIRRMKDIQRG